MAAPKLRILCLHGHHQNAARFREKTGHFRKAFRSMIDCTYIDSPIQEGQSTSDEKREDRQTWFTTTQDNEYRRVMNPDDYNGSFEQSAAFVNDFINKNGPFDGLFAFSQGAAFAHALLKQENLPSFKFAILCSGFAGYSANSKVDKRPITNLPTLHIICSDDQVVPNELSEELAALFIHPAAIIKRYDCGHCIPSLKLCRADLKKFFSQFEALLEA